MSGNRPMTDAVAMIWTRLRCSRCRYMREHPGPVTLGDLDGECGLCRAPLGAVTVYRLSERAAVDGFRRC